MSTTLVSPRTSTAVLHDPSDTVVFVPTRKMSDSEMAAMFVESCHDIVPATDATPERKPKRVFEGPGVFGSAGWWVWLFASNLIAALMVGAAFGFVYAFQASANGEHLTGSQIADQITRAPTLGLWLGLVSTVLIVCSVRWRMKASTPKLSLPRLSEMALLISIVIPLFIVSLSAYEITDSAWRSIYSSLSPSYQATLGFAKDDAIAKNLSSAMGSTNMMLLMMTIAVFPAVAEESICRGAVGRGLISRYGVVAGIIMTSFLFGLAHIHPAHVASAFCLGLVAHSVYRITQNFSTPILVHFLNNTLAVVLGSLAAQFASESTDMNITIWPYGIPAAAWVVTAIYLMHRNRVRKQEQEPVTI